MHSRILGNTHHTAKAPVSTISLPSEIWLSIFPYLKTPDLQSVTLTCTTFRYMAQPLLFSVLDVSPFLLSYNAELPLFRPRSYYDRFLRRLECYKLPHIVYGVRHCWISPYSRSGFPFRNQQDNFDPKHIINAAIDSLPYFPNLSALSWHCIDIAPEWWDAIQQLRIKTLWLNSSSLPSVPTTPLAFVEHLDLDQWPWEGRITNHVSIHEERTNGVGLPALQHIIHPTCTQSISVPRTDTACRLFTILADTIHDIRSLTIPFSSVSDTYFAQALEHCPRLESLRILPPSSDERYRDIHLDTFTESALPALTAYEGPYTHVLQFSRQALKQVSLWGFDDRPSLCDPESLVRTLLTLAETGNVGSLTSLQVTVVGITHELLQAFWAFTCLERLVIQSQDASRNLPMSHPMRPTPPVTMLYRMMNDVSLPPTLKCLKFSTRLTSPRVDLTGQEHEAALFMETVAQKHQAVELIEVSYGIYWTGMYSAIWGRIRDNAAGSGTMTTLRMGKNGLLVNGTKKDAGGSFSHQSTSKDYILSTVVTDVYPLPLGKLTFTEHRRTILFQQDGSAAAAIRAQEAGVHHEWHERRFWTEPWTKLRKIFRRG